MICLATSLVQMWDRVMQLGRSFQEAHVILLGSTGNTDTLVRQVKAVILNIGSDWQWHDFWDLLMLAQNLFDFTILEVRGMNDDQQPNRVNWWIQVSSSE